MGEWKGDEYWVEYDERVGDAPPDVTIAQIRVKGVDDNAAKPDEGAEPEPEPNGDARGLAFLPMGVLRLEAILRGDFPVVEWTTAPEDIKVERVEQGCDDLMVHRCFRVILSSKKFPQLAKGELLPVVPPFTYGSAAELEGKPLPEGARWLGKILRP